MSYVFTVLFAVGMVSLLSWPELSLASCKKECSKCHEGVKSCWNHNQCHVWVEPWEEACEGGSLPGDDPDDDMCLIPEGCDESITTQKTTQKITCNGSKYSIVVSDIDKIETNPPESNFEVYKRDKLVHSGSFTKPFEGSTKLPEIPTYIWHFQEGPFFPARETLVVETTQLNTDGSFPAGIDAVTGDGSVSIQVPGKIWKEKLTCNIKAASSGEAPSTSLDPCKEPTTNSWFVAINLDNKGTKSGILETLILLGGHLDFRIGFKIHSLSSQQDAVLIPAFFDPIILPQDTAKDLEERKNKVLKQVIAISGNDLICNKYKQFDPYLNH